MCSILTYRSEAWNIDDKTWKALNGANTRMVSVLTGKTPHQEISAKEKTFDMIA